MMRGRFDKFSKICQIFHPIVTPALSIEISNSLRLPHKFRFQRHSAEPLNFAVNIVVAVPQRFTHFFTPNPSCVCNLTK